MERAMEYVLLKVEEAYYGQNKDIRIARGSCMKDEGLSCNCLTGIGINYLGYLVFLCGKTDNCTISFMVTDMIGHIQVEYQGKPLMPVAWEGVDISNYYLFGQICKKQTDKSRQPRIAFRRYSSEDELKNQALRAERIMQEINAEKGMEYCYRLKFWIPFVATLRVHSLEDSGRAFLAMAIFMFPDRTLKLVYEAVRNGTISDKAVVKRTKDFLKEYLRFLEELGSGEPFSFYEFCRKFKVLTAIEISYFIEDIIHNPSVPDSEDLLFEIFSKALNNNLREKGKRGKLRKVISVLNE